MQTPAAPIGSASRRSPVEPLSPGGWNDRRHGRLSSRAHRRLTAGEVWTLCGFAVMFVHPVSHNGLIFPIYAISAGIGLVRHLRRHRRSAEPVSLLFVIATGVLLSLVGVLRSTPGVAQVAVPIILGPCVYYAIALGLDRRTTAKIPFVAIASTGVVAVSVLIVAFFQPQSWMFWLDPFAGSTQVGGAITVRMGALGSLAGLIPFLAYYVAAWRGPRGTAYRACMSVLVVAIVAAIVSGRTAVMLVTLLAVATASVARLVWWRAPRSAEKADREHRRAIPGAFYIVALLTISLTCVFAFSSISLGDAVDRTFDKFGAGDVRTDDTPFAVTNQASAELRLTQGRGLLDGFFASPLIGDSSGIVDGLVRNENRPWDYELQYHLILFRNGLLGAGLYLLAVAIAIAEIRRRWSGVDDETRHITIAAMAAAVGMLIANATNPYLQAVGQQWALFLPVMVICARSPGSRTLRSNTP